MIDKTTSAVLGFGSLRESLLSAGAVVHFRKQGAVHFEYTRSVALEEGKAKALKKDYNLAVVKATKGREKELRTRLRERQKEHNLFSRQEVSSVS